MHAHLRQGGTRLIFEGASRDSAAQDAAASTEQSAVVQAMCTMPLLQTLHGTVAARARSPTRHVRRTPRRHAAAQQILPSWQQQQRFTLDFQRLLCMMWNAASDCLYPRSHVAEKARRRKAGPGRRVSGVPQEAHNFSTSGQMQGKRGRKAKNTTRNSL